MGRPRISLPEELAEALAADEAARESYVHLSDPHRLRYAHWVGEAKTEETRRGRAEKAVEMLLDEADPPKPISGPQAVDDYIAGLPDDQVKVATRLRELVLEAVPELEESFKWGQPIWELERPVFYMKAAKAHVSFGFFYASGLRDPKRILEGEGKDMRHVKITGSRVPATALRKLIVQAARNAQKP